MSETKRGSLRARSMHVRRLARRPGEVVRHSPLVAMFGADVRSLAVWRVALGMILLVDFFGRTSYVRENYSDAGMLPRSVLFGSMNPWRWSVSFLNGTTQFQMALFAIGMIASMSLILGYRTRLMTIIAWVVLVSVQYRNPYLTNGGDVLLRLMLFWSMFLPLGAAWSWDARSQRGRDRAGHMAFSVATGAIALQIAFMYWFTAMMKTSHEWREDFTAIAYALNAGHLTRPFGEWLTQFPSLLLVLTVATLVIEFVAPVLFFSPVWTTGTRLAGIGLLAGLQLGIMATMNLGFFSVVSLCSMLVLTPAWVWEVAVPRVMTVGRRLRERLPQASLPAWRPAIARVALDGQDVSPELFRVRESESLRDPKSWPDPRAGSELGSKPPAPSVIGVPLWANVFAAVVLVLVLLWNVSTVSAYSLPRTGRSAAQALGVTQTWNMFAPHPPRSTVWITISGTLTSGVEVDLLTPLVAGDMSRIAAPVVDQPDGIAASYYNGVRWRKYLSALLTESRKDERLALAKYVCRTWNAEHDGPFHLESLNITHHFQRTGLEGPPSDVQHRDVATYTCL